MTTLNKILTLAAVLAMPVGAAAQEKEMTAAEKIRWEYNIFKQMLKQDYDDTRAKICSEYIAAVNQMWAEMDGKPAIPSPNKKEVKPAVLPPAESKGAKLAPPTAAVCRKAVKPALGDDDYANDEEFMKQRAQPISRIKVGPATNARGEKDQNVKYMDFDFYGSKVSVRLDKDNPLKFGKFTPYNVAEALASLSTKEYDNLIFDCLAVRDDYRLSDWAYYQLAQTVADQFCGKGTNEAALLVGYILYQSGYKIRYAYAQSRERIYPLIAFKRIMYDYGFWEIDGENYSLVEDNAPRSIAICPAKFPKEKSLSLYIPAEQKFADVESEAHSYTARKYPEISVSVTVNKNLLDFYDKYPSSYDGQNNSTIWLTQANTPLSEKVCEQMYPRLRAALEGKTKAEQVDMLLNFCQTAFTYGYDEDVWGADRIFFAEETLFYPEQDCEDRTILFTRLVRDLLGLKCALVHYEGHLASGVCFGGDEAYGTYYELDGMRYTVCDPTYENADIGLEMPTMEGNAIAVVELDK